MGGLILSLVIALVCVVVVYNRDNVRIAVEHIQSITCAFRQLSNPVLFALEKNICVYCNFYVEQCPYNFMTEPEKWYVEKHNHYGEFRKMYYNITKLREEMNGK